MPQACVLESSCSGPLRLLAWADSSRAQADAVERVHVDAALTQQQIHQRLVALARGQVQRRALVVVGVVRARSEAQQVLGGAHVAARACVAELHGQRVLVHIVGGVVVGSLTQPRCRKLQNKWAGGSLSSLHGR